MSRSLFLVLLFLSPLLADTAQLLERYDRDCDGALDRAELEAAHAASEQPGTSATVAQRILERLDTDADGRLAGDELDTLAEFLERRQQRRRSQAGERPRATDVAYTEPAGRLQTLDIYAPPGADGAPVIVYVHGGGWSKGDKRGVGAKARLFTGLGYVFLSVNYRLSPQVVHPAHIDDVAAALAWTFENIAEHGGDPARIGIMGHSAGAHLVALAATDHSRLGAHGLGLDVIKAVVPIDIGLYDIVRWFEVDPTQRWRSVFTDDPAVQRDASPYWHVEAGKDIPDFLFLMAGTQEFKSSGIDGMTRRLRDAGGGAERVDAPRKSHGSINSELGAVDDFVTRAVVRFFAERLEAEGTIERE